MSKEPSLFPQFETPFDRSEFEPREKAKKQKRRRGR
jgi:hypothetical protein